MTGPTAKDRILAEIAERLFWWMPPEETLATKLNTVYQRAEARDYLDVHALLKSGFSLADGLDFAKRVYGERFNTLLPLQALCYFEEPSLRHLPPEVRSSLLDAVESVR